MQEEPNTKCDALKNDPRSCDQPQGTDFGDQKDGEGVNRSGSEHPLSRPINLALDDGDPTDDQERFFDGRPIKLDLDQFNPDADEEEGEEEEVE